MTGKDLIKILNEFGKDREILFFDKNTRIKVNEISQEGDKKILISFAKYDDDSSIYWCCWEKDTGND